MKMDPTTESIAHFIGLFELSVEELRLRQDYLDFRLKREAQDAVEPIEPFGLRLQAPYELGHYDPSLSYRPDSLEPAPVTLPPSTGHAAEPESGLSTDEFEAISIGSAGSVFIQPPPPSFGFPVVAPGSIVAVTFQVAILADNDVFLDGFDTTFTDPVALQQTLDALVSVAHTLAGVDVPELPQGGDWLGLARDLLGQLEAAPETDGIAQIVTLRSDEAEGVFVNGVRAETAPEWTDLLPLHLRPKEEADEVEGEVETGTLPPEASDGEIVALTSDGVGADGVVSTPREHDFSRDFPDDSANPFSLDPGHEIVAGANKTINEIALGSKWVDAPVIVVQGNAAKFDAISQVNTLVEHDRIDGVAAGQASAGYNVAEIVTESSKDADAAAPANVLPQAWEVVRIEADLIQANWVKQFTYATDFDRAELTFSANATFLGLGENQIINTTVLNEFGYNYDLIFVAGNMIDGTVVSQKNALFDSDTVVTHAGAIGAAPEAAAIHGAGATGGQEDAPAEPEGAPADSLAPHEPGLSLADNLLLNQATLKTTGVDTFVEMQESFAATAQSLAEGAQTIAREVAQDALFAGKEALRVLHVDGDLVKLNLFEQTNILGDADQIRLESQTLRDRIEGAMKLVAGSNALVNLAMVTEQGVDSEVMTAGHVYDDAFIHQAGLFETDAVPDGVAMAGLANEAIAAFLSDDMLTAAELTDQVVPTSNHEAFSQLDVMQTALT